ncbi:MAG: hypothetical protein LBV06_08385 [Propionibacteriaceae bacterium]|jgi:hypothetical protein|nr:hypothetical protein [Propionibacteriaceae bacterium]
MSALVIPKKKRAKSWFEVQIDGEGQVYKLPPLEHLDLDIIDQMRTLAPKLGNVKTGKPKKNARQQDVLQAVGILTAVMDRYAPGLSGKLDMEQLNYLFEQWAQFSKVSVGESSASPA